MEAWEEAGIEGEIASEELGRYSYRKWGADCEVKLFPLEVTQFLNDRDWPERGRKRKWMAPKKALDLLEQPKLQSLVKRFQQKLEAIPT
jgi:phosphohistidine phosphatase